MLAELVLECGILKTELLYSKFTEITVGRNEAQFSAENMSVT